MSEPPPVPGDGWNRFERVVLYRLDELDKDINGVRGEIRLLRDEDIGKLKIEVAMLKVKSGVWGAAAGFIPAALIVIYMLLSGH